MPQPEGSQISFGYNPVLTNVGVNYIPSLTDKFIGQSVFPTVPTAVDSGIYPVWKAGDFLRRNGKEIANYEAVPLGGFATGSGSFSVKNWGVGTPWTNRDLANARRRGMTDQAFKNLKAKWVTTQGLLEMEFRIRDLVQTTGNWSTTIGGVAATPNASQFLYWDLANSTPVDDVLLWKRKMRLLSGIEPNTMVIPEEVMLALRKNTQVIARITPGYYGAGQAVPVQVSVDQIRILFGLEKILTPLSMYNSAAEGQADVLVDIWGRTMWLGYVAADANMETPSAGYQFSWTGDTANGLPSDLQAGEGPENMGSVMNDQGLFIREYIDQPRAAKVIEGMLWRSPNVVAAVLGMTWTTPITP